MYGWWTATSNVDRTIGFNREASIMKNARRSVRFSIWIQALIQEAASVALRLIRAVVSHIDPYVRDPEGTSSWDESLSLKFIFGRHIGIAH